MPYGRDDQYKDNAKLNCMLESVTKQPKIIMICFRFLSVCLLVAAVKIP